MRKKLSWEVDFAVHLSEVMVNASTTSITCLHENEAHHRIAKVRHMVSRGSPV